LLKESLLGEPRMACGADRALQAIDCGRVSAVLRWIHVLSSASDVRPSTSSEGRSWAFGPVLAADRVQAGILHRFEAERSSQTAD
jgi:hypothetical protein